MTDRTAVIDGSGGGIVFVAIIVLMVLGFIAASIFLGRGGAIFPTNLNVNGNAPGIVSVQ